MILAGKVNVTLIASHKTSVHLPVGIHKTTVSMLSKQSEHLTAMRTHIRFSHLNRFTLNRVTNSGIRNSLLSFRHETLLAFFVELLREVETDYL
jgi:hypothetical protein